MKKILSAWIEQVIQFDSIATYGKYMEDLNRKPQRFKVIRCQPLSSGEVIITIRKQYNKNTFPEE